LYRRRTSELQVFLVHPGGPFWSGKDRAVWTIPKGEVGPAETPLRAAKREFKEETGFEIGGRLLRLTPRKQPGGKVVHAFAVEGNCDAAAIRSNRFRMEWPPRSGRKREFAEVERADWFSLKAAREKLHKGQIGLLDELEERLAPAHRRPRGI